MPHCLPHQCNECHKISKISVEDIFYIGPTGWAKITGYIKPRPRCDYCNSQRLTILLPKEEAPLL
jgi:hypothetical protein